MVKLYTAMYCIYVFPFRLVRQLDNVSQIPFLADIPNIKCGNPMKN